MNGMTIGYWLATGLLAMAMLGGGFGNLMLPPEMAASMEHLGYPAYFARLLGAWKLLAAVAFLAPGFTRLKEWAYAGVFFTMSGAAISHLAVGDGPGGAAPPLVVLTFAVASWALAPASRRLGTRVPGLGGAPVAQPAA